ncbi:hypothetical protein [Aureimonas leprariae]|uniref:Uncharacterized protein n=1 Tax=Plantimonas leprariae TaxID=2615207 RepID=A0A7V7PRU1_9HYPH|nr:hypothetical protein [Aureimonas leprariae]KAB0681492.1 hypothetical protein F6X38_06320 [Aureimonas leprariae]
MSDPKTASGGQQPSKSVSPEESGHRVISPSAADGKEGTKRDVPEPPEYGETIDALDAVPSDVEPDTAGRKPA